MLHGDIDNSSPRRIIVTWEALTEPVVHNRKVLGFTVGHTETRVLRPAALVQVWRFTERSGLVVELVNFGVDQDEADRRLGVLDRRGTNPVNYSTTYDDVSALLADLPYRPDVLGVLDDPSRQAMYGGLGIGFDHLTRMI